MIYDVDCPSSDWQAIQKTLDLTSNATPRNQQMRFGQSIPNEVEVTGRSSLRQLFNMREIYFDQTKDPLFRAYVASTQQVAIADALTTTGLLWNIAMSNTSTKGHGSVLNQLDAVHSITTGYYQPYSSVLCEYDVIRGPTDFDPVTFPAYTGIGIPVDNAMKSANSTPMNDRSIFQHLTKSDVLNTSGRLDEYRLRWVELPFNGTAIGTLILIPRSPQNATQEFLTCSIGAGWGVSTMNTSTVSGSAEPVMSQVDTNAILDLLRTSDQSIRPHWNSGYSSFSEELIRFQKGLYYFPIFPQRPIIVTQEWASYLNPLITHLNTTIFNNLMGLNPASGSIRHQIDKAEIILAEMVANGLSRIGSTSQLQGSVRDFTQPDRSVGLDGNYWFAGKGNKVFQVDPVESKNWVKLRVSTTVNGYAYNTHNNITKLAIGLLLAYCLVALIHIFYAGISGISSTCWDSIGEVTALAMNSTPTTALRNTCAGITELNIFKLPVRVLTFRDEEGDGEHLELVFGDLDEKTLENKTIKANRVYGTMPSKKTHEKLA